MLSAAVYISHLRSYLNDRYIVSECGEGGGALILTEKYYERDARKESERKIHLLAPKAAIAFKLDNEQIVKKKGQDPKPVKHPLFHFLEDTAKPWATRCYFVIFYVYGQNFHADCIEFKSNSLEAEKIKRQLDAGVSWVRSLKRTIECYTNYRRNMRVRKFVFSTNKNPGPRVDHNRQLSMDPSVRYYHYDEVDNQPLADLQNQSSQTV